MYLGSPFYTQVCDRKQQQAATCTHPTSAPIGSPCNRRLCCSLTPWLNGESYQLTLLRLHDSSVLTHTYHTRATVTYNSLQQQQTHLALVSQQLERHRVRDGPWQQLDVERGLVKLEVDAAVGAHRRVGKALAKERQPSTTPVLHTALILCITNQRTVQVLWSSIW